MPPLNLVAAHLQLDLAKLLIALHLDQGIAQIVEPLELVRRMPTHVFIVRKEQRAHQALERTRHDA